MICIWSSWCHCHLVISCSIKILNCLLFWCQLTQVVLCVKRRWPPVLECQRLSQNWKPCPVSQAVSPGQWKVPEWPHYTVTDYHSESSKYIYSLLYIIYSIYRLQTTSDIVQLVLGYPWLLMWLLMFRKPTFVAWFRYSMECNLDMSMSDITHTIKIMPSDSFDSQAQIKIVWGCLPRTLLGSLWRSPT